MSKNCYIVATIRPWNIQAYEEQIRHFPGDWHLVTERKELNEELIDTLCPRYVFFPHWSWIVEKSILEKTECVCFHMTDLPYGKGGSPLQNLIVRGHKKTMITALRMENELDSGPVYEKRSLSLSGRAEEIYKTCAGTVGEMIGWMIRNEPKPIPQSLSGHEETFKRRTQSMSKLPTTVTSIEEIYDHIRMLDARGYPTAYIEYGNFCIQFTNADIADADTIAANVKISKK